MVKRSMGTFLPICLILSCILPICGPVLAGTSLDISAENMNQAILSIRTYDWKGTLLREGRGYFSDSEGTVTTAVPVVEGGYFVEALGRDGTEYIIDEINPLSESSGLVFTHLEENPEDFNFIEKAAPFPVQGDRVWISGADSTGRRGVRRADVLEIRKVPGLSRHLYMSTSLPAGGAGNPVFNKKGEVLGIVLFSGEGTDNTSIIVSTDMIRRSYGVSGEVVSLLTWSDGLTEPWLDRGRGLYLRGFVSYHAGKYENAVKCLQGAAGTKSPVFRKASLILGDCYREMGEINKAIVNYEKAVDRVKKPTAMHLSLTRLYLKQNRVTDARLAWEEVARHDKDGNVSVIITAWLLDATGNRVEALAAAKKAVEMNPESVWAHGTLGEIFSRQGRFNEAFLALEHCAAASSLKNEFIGELCYTAVRSGRYPQAVKFCSRAVKSGREKAQSLMHLADACAATGNETGALDSYRHSINEDPRNIETWCRMGDLLAKTGRYEEAVSLYLDALDAFPGSAWLNFKLGKVCGAMGDSQAAARQVQVLKDSNLMLARQLSLRLMEGNSVPGP